jgi:hypothetical protein
VSLRGFPTGAKIGNKRTDKMIVRRRTNKGLADSATFSGKASFIDLH